MNKEKVEEQKEQERLFGKYVYQDDFDLCPKCESKNIKTSHRCFSVPEDLSYETYCCTDCNCVWDIYYVLQYDRHHILGEGERKYHLEYYGDMIDQGIISTVIDLVKPVDYKFTEET